MLDPFLEVRVAVTQWDAEEGFRGDTCDCPVARAIRRFLPGAAGVEVFERTVLLLSADGETFEALLPHPMPDLVDAYDRGADMRPVSFALRVPLWAVGTGRAA